ncbi:MAG: FIST N-terminal domain-containing protein [Candidatus Micrarchaeota archaeon]
MAKLNVGTGFSENKDAFKAGKEAAESALKMLGMPKPTLSYVFFAGEYDPNKLSEGAKSVLKDSEFIGGSADAVYHGDKVMRTGVVVACVQSEYLHVGAASNDNVSKDPQGVARKTVVDALGKVAIDKYLDPYLLFTRMRKGSMKEMVKHPSFYVQVFSRGMKLPVMGDETKIIQGISEEIGLNVPIWGGSFGTSLEKLFGGKPYDIWMLHSGKVLKDGIIILFNTCSLVYAQSLAHGCKRTDTFGAITKVEANGYAVREISGKNVVDWYCEALGMKKDEFIKNSMMITQMHPLGIPDSYGNFVIRGAGVHNNGRLEYVAPFVEGWSAYIMDADAKYIRNAPIEVVRDLKENTKETKPSLVIAALCASRRAILQDKGVSKELATLRKEFGGTNLVGYSCFGEIGSKPGLPPAFGHLTADLFALYDKLLHEIN